MVQLDLFGRVPEVFIDVHEVSNRSKDTSITLFKKVLDEKNIPYRVKKLEVADLVLPNEYAVERKTVKDFCKSLFGSKDGRPRLFEQVRALSKAYKNPILLLEGGLATRLDPTTKSIFVLVERRKIGERLWNVVEEQIKIDPRQFNGAIRFVENSGVRVIQTFDAEHGAKVLYALYLEAKGLSKEGRVEKSYPIIRQKPPLKTIKDKQLFFLSGLPRISVINAKKILEKYGNPYNAILKFWNWSRDIEGIGEKTIDEIRKVLLTNWKGDDSGSSKRNSSLPKRD